MKFDTPLGPLGTMAELVIGPYLRRLIEKLMSLCFDEGRVRRRMRALVAGGHRRRDRLTGCTSVTARFARSARAASSQAQHSCLRVDRDDELADSISVRGGRRRAVAMCVEESQLRI